MLETEEESSAPRGWNIVRSYILLEIGRTIKCKSADLLQYYTLPLFGY